MNALYDWYKDSRDSLARYESEKQWHESHELDEQIDEMVKGWKEIIEIVDRSHPQIKERYMRNQEMQKSFTSDQINFICEQIGDWYLQHKDTLVNYEQKTHRLGHAKELLKIMICGDEKHE